MNTRGLIEIVLLTVGRDAGLIGDRLFTMLALMAIATTLLTSPVLRRLRPAVTAVVERDAELDARPGHVAGAVDRPQHGRVLPSTPWVVPTPCA